MNIALSKIELTQQLLATKNQAIIKHMQAVFATQEDDLWDEMPDAVQQSVNRGLQQASKNLLKDHSQVRKKYNKWLKK